MAFSTELKSDSLPLDEAFVPVGFDGHELLALLSVLPEDVAADGCEERRNDCRECCADIVHRESIAKLEFGTVAAGIAEGDFLEWGLFSSGR